jgi:hypothetical protein
MLRTSAAVLAMLCLGHGAMAQDAGTEDPVDYVGEDIFIDYEVILVEGTDEGVPTDEEIVYDDEGYVDEGYVDGEVVLSDGIGDGLPLDGEVEYVEGEEGPVADGSGDEEPVYVTTCDGCESEFGVGGPEVQRDNTTAGVIENRSSGNDAAVARSGSNACDSGPLSTAWICTVQNGAWRD